ncbi:MAG: caspase family protein, partial [Bradyrhizobium sp.]
MTARLLLLLGLMFSVVVSVAVSRPALAAGDRFALVIGNAKYPDAEAPLKEPINDARDLSDELKRDGFGVETLENANGDTTRRALERLYGRIKPGSVALVFFSGFGIQSSRTSYMIPVDAQIWQEADVRRDGISLEQVLQEINSRGAGVKIALLDASRRNPYERRFRTASAGLAPVIAPSGTLVMYSAALSSVVSDTGRDRSLFVQELLKEIRVPDLTAEETLNRTRVGVTRASRSEQVPWISSSLAEDFSFVPGAGGARPTPPAESSTTPAPVPT